MQKYLMATAFVLALATPAFAAQFYVALDTTINQCRVMSTQPDGTMMRMVGDRSYPTLADAELALSALPECNS